MSEKMVGDLKEYVRSGGKLLVSGTDSFARFGEEFLGAKEGRVVSGVVYHVPAADGTVPVASGAWRLLELAGAKSLAALGTTPLRDEQLLPHPAAILHPVGRGAVAYVPCDVFRTFARVRYPLLRDFVHEVLQALSGPMDIAVDAPCSVDAVFRRKGERQLINLINRTPGVPHLSTSQAKNDIPPAGPVTIRMNLPEKPAQVYLAFEDASLTWAYTGAGETGQLRVDVSAVKLHAAVVIEMHEKKA
jgi:hypothetical protein